jgi:hypothetical protein
MNLTGTLLDTNAFSANDIDIDTFGNKLNHNYSEIGSLLETNHIHRDPFGQISENVLDRDPFGQIESP